VRGSFATQGLMQLIGATLERVEPGEVDIALPYRDDFTQQHAFLHGAVTTAIADSAAGYAALSLMPAGSEVLSVEFKINLLRPATGPGSSPKGASSKPARPSPCRAPMCSPLSDDQTGPHRHAARHHDRARQIEQLALLTAKEPLWPQPTKTFFTKSKMALPPSPSTAPINTTPFAPKPARK
jgi:uncharacterized protein (TIGR00369 family)